MISFSDLLALGFLGVFGYGVYQVKQAVDILRQANFSNYSNYKEAIKQGERKAIWKPARKQTEGQINEIKGDRTRITTKSANGISHTEDALVDLTQADPEAVMGSIDELGRIRGA